MTAEIPLARELLLLSELQRNQPNTFQLLLKKREGSRIGLPSLIPVEDRNRQPSLRLLGNILFKLSCFYSRLTYPSSSAVKYVNDKHFGDRK